MAKYKIAIDAMGGDYAPKQVIKGLNYFCKDYKDINNVHFVIYGKKKILERLIKHNKHINGHYEIVDTPEFVAPDAKPSAVIKKSTNTSMWQAIKSVKDKTTDAVVSAGNTGCLMAFSHLQLRTLANIKRPAITTMMPTKANKNVVMLDLGASIDYTSETFIDHTIMGSVYSSIINKIDKPTIGLLNIGEEDSKGNDELKKANQKLKENKSEIFKYYGFVEGHDILFGTTDVVVTDGWTGNIALKSIEGTAKFLSFMIKNAFKGNSLWSKFWGSISYLLVRRSMNKISKKMDIRRYNGAVLAGLNGIVIKSHGNSDAVAFYFAIKYALDLVKKNFKEKIEEALESYYKANNK